MIRIDVAVVGGGFSGVMVAANLARHASERLSLALFESGELGRGVAYGTKHAQHLLNTRAQAMSAFTDDPDHFVRALGINGTPRSFASRRVYGDYIAGIARQAFERPRFSNVKDRVASIERTTDGTFVLKTETGTEFEAFCTIVATGNALPNDDFLPLSIVRHPGYVADPWRFDYRVVGGRVLLVGSGLTALDALVALEASGHRGFVDVVSRHGLFPEVHDEASTPYDVVPALDARTARTLLRSFRRQIRDAAARSFGWQSVLDAIRPESEALWKRLPVDERRRFDRHLRARWERHRHRAPAAVDAVRERYAASGKLRVYAGRVVASELGRVSVRLATGETTELMPDWIVNCTGTGKGARLYRDPLVSDLIANGLVARDPLGYGLRSRVANLWLAGPLQRGTRFESTAVPELREIAAGVAVEVIEALRADAILTG
jgi:uncharacterized NAD(P)/FAD-binding protein YdhS